MLEATHEMDRERTVSWRFEKHIILGDVIKGWNEYDSKGRPVLHVKYQSPTGTGGHVQPYYCHNFQHDECDLPCPHNHVHEYIPKDLKQESLRRQGFKGVTLIVFPLVRINIYRQTNSYGIVFQVRTN